jgi:hypothetical protein
MTYCEFPSKFGILITKSGIAEKEVLNWGRLRYVHPSAGETALFEDASYGCSWS